MKKRYVVEPIETSRPPQWGDLDPSGQRITGSYGTKHRGGVSPEDSVVTEENGFDNVITLPPGVSPQVWIAKQK